MELWTRWYENAENGGPEKEGRNLHDQYFGEMQDGKTQDRNTEDHFEGLENAGPENVGPFLHELMRLREDT